MAALALPLTAAPAAGVSALAAPQPQVRTYIVQLAPAVPPGAVASTVPGVEVRQVYTAAINGFAARMPAAAAAALSRNPRVLRIAEDGPVQVDDTQSNPAWSLDRADQRYQPLSDSYSYPHGGAGVTAYVLDTGIRASHTEFGGRVRAGYDGYGGGAADCNGHGTHVAGSLGGQTYGMAKEVSLVAMRAFSCGGVGSWEYILAAMDWMILDHEEGQPAVVNMSFTGYAPYVYDDAVRSVVNDGITVVAAAGNADMDACHVTPARVPEAITVGATTRFDAKASFSNYGPCLDLFMTGTAVTSAWHLSDSWTAMKDGTSMSAPHVAGAVAVMLGQQPSLTPAQVHEAILANSTQGIVVNPGPGSPNRFLYAPPTAVGPLGLEIPQGLPEPNIPMPFVSPWDDL